MAENMKLVTSKGEVNISQKDGRMSIHITNMSGVDLVRFFMSLFKRCDETFRACECAITALRGGEALRELGLKIVKDDEEEEE